MAILLALFLGLVAGFIIGFWVSLQKIEALEEQVHYEQGRAIARDLEPTIEKLEQGKDWLWPSKG
jgi:uncharacterized membrane protein YraQ (UPF0718 family)